MNKGTFYIALAVAVVMAALVGRVLVMPDPERDDRAAITLEQAAKSTGGPTIGGPFSLTDHEGMRVTEKDFLGRFMLIYFGYTFCPDICPTSLTTMAQAMDLLGEDADKVTPVFVSVDWERDTPEHLKEYISYFHPALVALTGTPEEIRRIAGAYRIYFAKIRENTEDGDLDDDYYLMDHSSIVYLMGPDGNFRAHFAHGTSAEDMAARIREFF